MSRPRYYSQAAQAKRMTPDQIEPEQDDDEQFEWYDEEQPDDMYAGEDLEGDGQ